MGRIDVYIHISKYIVKPATYLYTFYEPSLSSICPCLVRYISNLRCVLLSTCNSHTIKEDDLSIFLYSFNYSFSSAFCLSKSTSISLISCSLSGNEFGIVLRLPLAVFNGTFKPALVSFLACFLIFLWCAATFFLTAYFSRRPILFDFPLRIFGMFF